MVLADKPWRLVDWHIMSAIDRPASDIWPQLQGPTVCPFSHAYGCNVLGSYLNAARS
jgi:hypothetical protein